MEAKQIETSQIVKGVFIGMWLFAISSSVVWFGITVLLRATGDIR